jgi:hypothetical protein
MNRIHFVKGLAVLSISLGLLGCSHTKATNIQQSSSGALSKPTRILVQDFSVSSEAVKTSSTPLAKLKDMTSSDNGQSEKLALQKEVGSALSDELMDRMKKLGFDVARADAGKQPSSREIIVTGTITNVDEGNSVRRAIIGFGAGQSSVDSDVMILGAGNQKLLSFKAHSDSGNAPGAAATAGVGAAAEAGTAATAATSVARAGAKAYQSASAHQASNLADRISDEFETYAKNQGWIAEK